LSKATAQLEEQLKKKTKQRAEFVEKYASKGVPVVISGLNVSKEPWTLEFFRKKCNVEIELMQKNSSARKCILGLLTRRLLFTRWLRWASMGLLLTCLRL